MADRDVDLSGVRAVVTGATSGLGLAMARALLEAGARVAIGGRPGGRLSEVVASCLGDGLAAEAMPVDVRDPGSVERLRTSLRRTGKRAVREHLDEP